MIIIFILYLYFRIFNRTLVDYEDGILQTIGFKEFIPYLEKYDKSHDNLINEYVVRTETNEEHSEPDGYKSLLACLDELKLVTRRYSKKQLKWIKNRLLASDMREKPLVYPLDTSDVTFWHENVFLPATHTIDCYINDKEITLKPLEKMKRLSERMNEETSHFCNICNRTFIGEFQWELHMKSNKHKKTVASLHRREKKLQQQTEIENKNTN